MLKSVEVLEPAPDGRLTEPIIGPGGVPVTAEGAPTSPRLVRRTLTLDDGHQVCLAVCGRGVPLVLVHGFSAEGLLYAQTLSRLVSMGFKVVALDAAGHGGTQGLPTGGRNLGAYTRLLGRALDALGIERAVLAGHSMGGRLVTELAAVEPERAIAVVLLDAIVGDTWDRMVNVFRVAPPLMAGLAAVLAADTVSTVPVLHDRRQAAKLGRLVAPVIVGHLRRPWRMIGPGISILRSGGSRWMLERIAAERIPLVAVHADRDLVVPLSTAASAARRARGELVTVHRASHSWLLKDPETLPAIIAELRGGRLGAAIRTAVVTAGLDPDQASDDALESAFYAPDALVVALTPEPHGAVSAATPRPPRYRWTISSG
ncbi:alpha/beta hydrolase [soil metagenome]